MTKMNQTWVVRTEQGEKYTNRVVISNADPKGTICFLVDRKLVPAQIIRKVKDLQPSRSVFSVFVGTDLNLIERDLPLGTFLISQIGIHRHTVIVDREILLQQ